MQRLLANHGGEPHLPYSSAPCRCAECAEERKIVGTFNRKHGRAMREYYIRDVSSGMMLACVALARNREFRCGR